MNERDTPVPKGSYVAGHRALLPRGSEPPIKVYVNGVEQVAGTDYRIVGREIVFSRPILKEEKLSGIRWLSMLIGVVGTYRQHETVDIEYRLSGKTRLASDVAILPD